MNSLSQRIDLEIVLMNGVFNTWIKIKDDDPDFGEFVGFMLLGQTYATKELQMIQSAIRKPNSKKLHYTKFQRIGMKNLVDKLKKYKFERGGMDDNDIPN